MALDWERMFRRYVFDEVRTPYFVRVSKLSRSQAHYEVLFYGLLVVPTCVLFGVAAMSGKLPHGDAPIVAIYALAAACATAVFAWNKNQVAGSFSATVPLAMMVYLAVFGFPLKMSHPDSMVLVAVLVAWAAYNWRIVLIAARYPEMIDRPDAPKAKPRRRHQDYLTFEDEPSAPTDDKQQRDK